MLFRLNMPLQKLLEIRIRGSIAHRIIYIFKTPLQRLRIPTIDGTNAL